MCIAFHIVFVTCSNCAFGQCPMRPNHFCGAYLLLSDLALLPKDLSLFNLVVRVEEAALTEKNIFFYFRTKKTPDEFIEG